MFKLLIIILTIFSTTFPMDSSKIITLFNTAQSIELASPGQAIETYTKIINIQLPAADPVLGDSYSLAHSYQQIAANKIQSLTQKILDNAQEFLQKNQFDSALALLKTIPEDVRKKDARIGELESDVIAKKQQATNAAIATLQLATFIATANEAIKNAEISAQSGNYVKAYQTLAPLKTQTLSQDISKKATELEVKIKEQEAQSLINKEKYDEASTILNTLPASKQEVIDLKAQIDNEKEIKRARELATRDNYQEAYKILESLKNEGFLKANALDQQLIKEQLKEANDLANTGDYAKAYAVLDILKANRPGEEVETEKEIKARQKTQQEAELQKQADETQRKAQEAEKERLAQEELQKKQAAERQEQEQLTKAQQFISAENYEEARKILSTLDLNKPLSSPEATQRRDALRELIRAYQYGQDKNYTAAYSILDNLKTKKLTPEIITEVTKLETKIKAKQQQEATAAANKIVERSSAEEALKKADEFFKAGNYAEALPLVTALKNKNPGQPIAEQASQLETQIIAKQQEQAETVARIARETAAQQELLAQIEKLKNTVIRLADALNLLAKNIVTPPSSKDIHLSHRTRYRSRHLRQVA